MAVTKWKRKTNIFSISIKAVKQKTMCTCEHFPPSTVDSLTDSISHDMTKRRKFALQILLYTFQTKLVDSNRTEITKCCSFYESVDVLGFCRSHVNRAVDTELQNTLQPAAVSLI